MIDAGTYGAMNWVDLSTPDIAAAAEFYSMLLGWTVETSTTPMGEYFVGKVGDREVAGMMQQSPEIAGSPPTWTVFCYVEHIEETLAKVGNAGGLVLQPAFDIPGDARVAVVADPTGAMFALIAGPRPEGPYLSEDPGFVSWVELLTRDPAAAQGFYGAVFDWKALTEQYGPTEYTSFQLDEENVAGMMMMPDEVPAEAPAHWSIYFGVTDCAAVEQKAVELGGRVLVPTKDIEMGRFAVLADPQGATFNLMEYGG